MAGEHSVTRYITGFCSDRLVSFQDSSECNIYYPLPELSCLQEPYSPPPSPELPFVQESSSPPPTPLPEVEQVDLDAWLNDVNKEDEEIPEKL